jgi:uncharacterized membrane protein (GlpM family)
VEVLVLVVKAAVSGVVIVAGTVIANRLSPSLGGWVAAFPTISFLTVSWLWFDGGSGSEATGLFIGVLWGMLPTAVLIASVVVMLKNGLPLAVSMLLGSAVWVIFTLVAQKGGLFGA